MLSSASYQGRASRRSVVGQTGTIGGLTPGEDVERHMRRGVSRTLSECPDE
ncbi:hypothetical protein V5F01_38810 [Streptomyces sp. NRRL B-2790]|uniref:hypothetical protein n=1 Tax=Streptomyces sp. NRRL B-2790 TaxID=1463835 RepID=UPI003562B1DE